MVTFFRKKVFFISEIPKSEVDISDFGIFLIKGLVEPGEKEYFLPILPSLQADFGICITVYQIRKLLKTNQEQPELSGILPACISERISESFYHGCRKKIIYKTTRNFTENNRKTTLSCVGKSPKNVDFSTFLVYTYVKFYTKKRVKTGTKI